MTLRVGSLFSGYGGLDMAAEAAFGAETAWVSDIDKGSCKVLEHNRPDVPNIGDITTVDWSTVEPVDVLVGGFPCQDLSHAGNQKGLEEGTRSGLWLNFQVAIKELRPRFVIIENVRGLLSAKTAESEPTVTIGPKGGRKVGLTNRALGRVLSDLAELGYNARWIGLRASDVGAAHNRFRVFILAWDAQNGYETLPQSSSGRSDEGSLGGADSATGTGPVKLLPTPAVNDMGAGKTVEKWDSWTAAMKEKHGNSNGHGPSLSIEALRLLPTPTVMDHKASGGSTPSDITLTDATVRTNMGTESNPRHDPLKMLPTPTRRDHKDHMIRREPHRPDDADTLSRALVDFGPYSDAVERWGVTTGVSAPVPTLPTGKQGQAQLSAPFVEWMMGLPEGWVTNVPGITRAEALKLCGNGVVPQQAYAAISLMLGELNE